MKVLIFESFAENAIHACFGGIDTPGPKWKAFINETSKGILTAWFRHATWTKKA